MLVICDCKGCVIEEGLAGIGAPRTILWHNVVSTISDQGWLLREDMKKMLYLA